jgi:D-lactate dehydrogenase
LNFYYSLVSLYAPLNDSTYHLINKEALDKIKQGAMLINTSRGGLVDTKALVDCLKSRKLRGVALDVYENEKQYFFNDYSQQVKFLRSFSSLFSCLGYG